MEVDFPKLEEKILDFWKKNKIFEKTQKVKKKDFVFFEGPPYANGRPGIHHFLARAFKDLICRFKSMQGFRVLRKAGWDTHGLPTEMEVEKILKVKSKKEIEEKIGIEKFVEECKKNIFIYKEEWEKFTERIGYWIDLEDPYITCAPDYIETLWFLFKKIFEKNLLYEDFKVSAYCPRCQTVLSSHEVAQGYKKIKENSIYVKFRVKSPLPNFHSLISEIYLLVWTTTPWTLPSNVAIALNPEFDYISLKTEKEILILAKEAKEKLKIEGEILKEWKGKDLVGLKYEPVFDYYKEKFKTKRIWQILAADFVTLEKGTGLVHIAPAFGEEDFELVKNFNSTLKEDEKIPLIINVDEEGKFKEEVKDFARIYIKDADPKIVENLKERGFLFKEEIYEHDYPFCWRCKTPLFYYAKKGWFLRVTAVKEKLIKNNQKINWYPSHFKEGRFGQWLKEVKDWALSRERYWGTPIPIWECKNCGHKEVIGSREDLRKQKFSKNRYLILRHGHSKMNEKNILISKLPEKISCPLTERGKKEIEKAAEKLKKERIDLIFSSDLRRARETAEIVAKKLNLKVHFDKRLRDISFGIFEGKKLKEYEKYWKNYEERFKKRIPKGENYNDVKMRMYSFLEELENKFSGKTILIVSHQRPLTMLEGATKGFLIEDFWKFEKNQIKTGEIREIEFKKFPYNKEGELDFHRPYIDGVKFFCPRCQEKMERQKEVMDVWYDSGAMPFSQVHWPFEKNQKESKPPRLFPADFICEGIDQTRGWFYTLLAVSTLLGFGSPYKNVLAVGLVLDEKGEKMSKSRGNVVEPQEILEKYGADVTRWYFYTINQPSEPKLFSEKDVREAKRRFYLILWNCFQFFKTYCKKTKIKKIKIAKDLLDRWILSRFQNLLKKVTQSLENYDIFFASRQIEDFVINDLSLWYIRRSRRKFHFPKNKKEFKEKVALFQNLFLNLTKVLAPFLPFLAEYIFQEISGNKFKKGISVHLEKFPTFEKNLVDKKLEKEMEIARKICSLALAKRKEEKIKVRQPLLMLKIKRKLKKEILDEIKEEVNVKKVIVDKNLKEEIYLDTKITPELKKEGILRELIREIQVQRKELNLTPEIKIQLAIEGLKEIEEIFKENKREILKMTRAEELRKKPKIEKEIQINGEKVKIKIAFK